MKNKLKILFYDIETAPNLSYVWGKYEQDVIAYEKEWYMLCFAYKWLGEKKVHAVSLPDFKLYKKDKQNDKHVIEKLWELFNEADIVIAHNGDKFDQRKSNARFAYHGLTPPSPYKTIDTKKVAKKYFAFNSNKLDDLGDHLGIGRKIQTGGFSLWKGCMEGDEKAWKKMIQYNKNDVKLLEDVYLKLRPWITNHPNLNIMLGTDRNCPNCGSNQLQKRGTYKTNTNVYQQYWCKSCGKWPRQRLSDKSIIRPNVI